MSDGDWYPMEPHASFPPSSASYPTPWMPPFNKQAQRGRQRGYSQRFQAVDPCPRYYCNGADGAGSAVAAAEPFGGDDFMKPMEVTPASVHKARELADALTRQLEKARAQRARRRRLSGPGAAALSRSAPHTLDDNLSRPHRAGGEGAAGGEAEGPSGAPL